MTHLQSPPDSLRRDVLLCFQVALLGAIHPRVRGVTVGWSEQGIEAIVYVTGPVFSEDEEEASTIEGEVMASFPDHEVVVRTKRCDVPTRPPMLLAWVYFRKENDGVGA